MHIRRFVMGAVTLVMTTGLITDVDAGSASAAPTVTANGTATCGAPGTSGINAAVSTITFSPPLTSLGTSPETATLFIKLRPCTTTATNLRPGGTLKGKIKEIIELANSNCTSLMTSIPEALTVKWSYRAANGAVLDYINPTTMAFNGFTSNPSAPPWPAGNAGFQFPGVGGSASVTGSFPSTGGGANFEAYLSSTPAMINNACVAGYASDTFAFGNSFFA